MKFEGGKIVSMTGNLRGGAEQGRKVSTALAFCIYFGIVRRDSILQFDLFATAELGKIDYY